MLLGILFPGGGDFLLWRFVLFKRALSFTKFHGWGCDEPPQLRLSVIHLILGHIHGGEIKNPTD